MIKQKVKKLLQKIMSNKMTALDWRLVYGIIEKDFKKHDLFTSLPPELENSVEMGLKDRINLIKTEVEEDKKA